MKRLKKLTNILLSEHEWIMSIRRKLFLIQCLLETNNVVGDVVEIGCYKGLNSVLIQTTLNICGSDKSLHLYDSFEGLPEWTDKDRSFRISSHYPAGKFKAHPEDVIENFKKYKLKEPTIHVGMIEEATDFPQQISLAFIDLDLYEGTMSAFSKVWPLMSPGGILILDDFGFDDLPGVERAGREFFGDSISFARQAEITGIVRK